MKQFVIVFIAVLAACSGTDPEEPTWTVRGTVTATGQPVEGARIDVSSIEWTSLGGSGLSRADGSFEVQAYGSCGTPVIKVQHTQYQLVSIEGFVPDMCPTPLSGVRVLMEPYPALTVVTEELPLAALEIGYEEPIVADGGDQSYRWSLFAGSLPPGLELQGNQVVGTPTEAGAWDFTVRVESGDGQQGEAALSIEVVGEPIVAPRESCSAYPDSAMVAFEDARLQRTIRSTLGVAPTVKLTCQLVATLTELHAPDSVTRDLDARMVESIGGLQNLTALTVLDLSGNWGLGDLGPLSDLVELTWLNVEHVSASDVGPLTNLTKLEFLNLASNDIGDIQALSEMKALKHLDLASNAIGDIGPLAGAVDLRHLDLRYNTVSTLDALTDMAALEYLNVSGNPIEGLEPLAGKLALDTLVAANDLRVTDVTPLAGLSGLVYLDLRGSDLDDVSPLDGLAELETLDLGFGEIPSLVLEDLPSLERLYATFSGIESITLSEMPSLMHLALDMNGISDVSGLATLTSLTTLDLTGNDVSDASPLATLGKLVVLRLPSNAVTDLSGFENLTDLEALELAGNAPLSDIQPLLDNSGLGSGDWVSLDDTAVPCSAVSQLESKGVTVYSQCS